MDRWYASLVSWSLRHRAVIAGVTVLVFLSTVPLFIAVSKAFLPQDDQSEFEISLRTPEGMSLENTELMATRIATRVRELAPETDLHAGDRRVGRGADAEYRIDLRPAEADRRARARSVRDHERGARAAGQGVREPEPAHRRAAGRDVRRRRQSERGHPVPDQRSRAGQARGARHVGRRRSAQAAGTSSTSTRRSTSASRKYRSASIA